jgi:CrcB protein
MTRLLVIGCGGFIGAIARYSTTLWIQGRVAGNVPYGTMGVNVLGCLLLGMLVGWLQARPEMGEGWQLFLRAGVLGAFTTFSAFGFETVTLFSEGQLRAALVTLFGNLLLGGLALVLGSYAAKGLLG